jgi:hypothetical protein
MFQGQALQIIFWRDSSPPMKEAVEMELAQSRDGCQLVQGGLVHVVLVQVADDPRNAFKIVHATNLSSGWDPPTRFLR